MNDTTINPNTLQLSEFPLNEGDRILPWVENIAQILYSDYHERILAFLKIEIIEYPKVLWTAKINGGNMKPALNGWSRLDTELGWVPIKADELPMELCLDYESVRKTEDSPYLPFLAYVFGSDSCWYTWRHQSPLPAVAEFPADRIIVSQRGVSFDRRYNSCEYQQENFYFPCAIHIDVFGLATAIAGLSDQQEKVYKAFQERKKKGSVPKWVQHSTMRDLESLAKHFCGIKISKSVRSEEIEKRLEADFNYTALPDDVTEYCAQDVWATFLVARRTYQMACNGFYPYMVSFWGIQELSQSRFHLKDFDPFIEQSESEYQEVVAKIRAVLEQAARYEHSRGRGHVLIEERKIKSKFKIERDDLMMLISDIKPEAFCYTKHDLECADDVTDILVQGIAQDVFQELSEPGNVVFEEGVCLIEWRSFSFCVDGMKAGSGWYKALCAGGQTLKDKFERWFTKILEKEEKQLIRELMDLVPDVLADSQLDWTRWVTGEKESEFRWFTNVRDKDFRIGRDTLICLKLLWKHEPIYWEEIKTEKSKTGRWRTKKEPLPHPEGPDKNLSNPLCKDFGLHVATGDLQSLAIDQKQLIELHKNLNLITQWTAYRGRLNEIYRLPVEDDLLLTTGNIDPVGTATRRAKSSLYLVSPKPSEKIGSGFFKQISAPKGMKIIGGDFDQQETWFGTLLTDAKKGKVASNSWIESVLNGDKDAGTDDHSQTAEKLGIPRPNAKTLNFALQYRAGLVKLTNKLAVDLQIPIYEAAPIAADFLYYKQGDEGVYNQLNKLLLENQIFVSEAKRIAKERKLNYKGVHGIQSDTLEVVAKYADTPGIRTAGLDVKIPDSLDPSFVNGEFFTTRNNWSIQSGCVDLLHTVLTLIRAFCMEYEVDYWFIFAVHDSLFFAVDENKTDLFKAIMQRSHYLAKEMLYQQARLHARKHSLTKDKTTIEPDFKCPESQKWFSELKVGNTIYEAI